jgi:2-polyprenyl-6-hydroxyphenyl methylase / 3-demethylubiquinone-9 3-methyltransferase
MSGTSHSVVDAEIARFAALAGTWWDPAGPMRPLHAMNPVRAAWIMERIRAEHRAAAPGAADRGTEVRKARVLDVGCGAGLLAEALARAGCAVLGIDAAAELIGAAETHAASRKRADPPLDLTYRATTAEALAAEGARFPVITALEIIEHVADPAAFVATLASLLEPGGMLFLSTLNRTNRSWLTAKLGAEYLLRLLPVGTHEWRHFITPPELARLCREAGLRLAETAGLSFEGPGLRFRVSRDLSVNYIALARA